MVTSANYPSSSHPCPSSAPSRPCCTLSTRPSSAPRRSSPPATERLRDALLHELLTRGVPGWHIEWKEVPGMGTIPSDWEVVRLGDVIPKFEYGTSARCHREPLGIPVLRIPNIARGELDLADVKYANLSDSESANLQLAKGDILLVRTNGNPDICGKCWVTEDLEGQWAFASYLVRGRPDQSRTDPAFIGHFLTSHTGRRSLRAHIRTSAGNYQSKRSRPHLHTYTPALQA